MTGRKEIELPQSLLFFLRVCESCVLRMKILVAFYGLLLASYLRTIFGRPTLNSTSEIDMMATLQRSKREFQESDYDDYYNDLELEILESRKELLEKTFLPPDLPLSSSVKNNIQLLKETTKNAPEYMMDLYKSYSEKKVSRPSSDIVRSFMNINIAGGLQLLTIHIFEIIEKSIKIIEFFYYFLEFKNVIFIKEIVWLSSEKKKAEMYLGRILETCSYYLSKDEFTLKIVSRIFLREK